MSETSKNSDGIPGFNAWSYGFAMPLLSYGEKTKPAMKYAEVEAVREKVDVAKKELIEVENAYLASRGYMVEIDHEKEAVFWRSPKGIGNRLFERQDALMYARYYENADKSKAEREIERLKAEHGIE